MKPGSKKPGIDRQSETQWIVRVRERPVENKANEALILAVSEELKIPQRRIRILQGEHSRKKLIEIEDAD